MSVLNFRLHKVNQYSKAVFCLLLCDFLRHAECKGTLVAEVVFLSIFVLWNIFAHQLRVLFTFKHSRCRLQHRLGSSIDHIDNLAYLAEVWVAN
jgi:aminoglycoside phosphotransferase